MKHYSLAHETEDHYVLHDSRDGKMFHIAKKGIDHNTSDLIKSLPAKKEWAGYDNDQPRTDSIPGTDQAPVEEQPQSYESGGFVAHYSDGGSPTEDDIDVKAKKYGWDAAMVKDLKERRASTPQSTPSVPPAGESGPEIDPGKAAQFEKGFQGLAEGGAVGRTGTLNLNPNDAFNNYASEQGIVGGTIRDGSEDEKFLFGTMIFNIEKARKISKEEPNATVPVSSKWLDKIRLNKEHAMNGKSDKPVFIAQIHTHHGLKPLLIDGNHRMFRAVQDGAKEIPAYVFTPEQSASIVAQNHMTPKQVAKKLASTEAGERGNGSYYGGGQVSNDTGPRVARMYAEHHPSPGYDIHKPVQHYADGTDYVSLPQGQTPAEAGDIAANAAVNALAPNTMPNPNLPPNFSEQVQSEVARLRGGPSGGGGRFSIPLPTTPEMEEQAKTNVAKNYMDQQEALQQQSAANYQSQVDKINADNQTRAKAGLPILPVPPPPTQAGQPTMPIGGKVPLDQQVSMQMPSSQPGLGIPMTDLSGQYQQALSQQEAGMRGVAAAQSTGAAQSAQAMQDFVAQEKYRQALYEQENADAQRHLSDLEQGVIEGRINPNRMWQNMGTAGQISAAIGLALGGVGAGITHSPNQALEVIQNAINRDIQAQMADRSDKMNLYKIGLEKYRDQRAAQQFATLQANALLQGQLGQISQRTQSQAVKAMAEQGIGALKAQSIPMQQQLAMQAAQMRMFNEPAPKQGLDVNKIHAGIALGVIPKEVAEPMTKEVGDYNQLRGVLDDVDNTFDILNRNKTYTERVFPHWTPTFRDASKKYEAEGNRFLGEITKKTEGRVTPADVELMRTSLPIMGDPPDVVQQKLNKIKDQIREGYKFGNLKTYNLLPTNDPVITPSSTRSKRFTPSAPVR